ncbi:hypothetical protein ACXM0N_16535 [Peribacillus simplex]
MGVKQSGYYWTEEMAQKLRNNSQFFSKGFFKSTILSNRYASSAYMVGCKCEYDNRNLYFNRKRGV